MRPFPDPSSASPASSKDGKSGNGTPAVQVPAAAVSKQPSKEKAFPVKLKDGLERKREKDRFA